jgi:AraC-like DNA-binding protein
MPTILVLLIDSTGVQKTFLIEDLDLDCDCGCISKLPGKLALCRILEQTMPHKSRVHQRQRNMVRLIAEPDAITKAKTFVCTHLERDLSLGRVAKVVSLSAGYFSELFGQVTGMTFIAYVASVRVESIKALLANSTLRITEIAYNTGFKSLSQFNRVFERLVGSSPTEYREKLRKCGKFQKNAH